MFGEHRVLGKKKTVAIHKELVFFSLECFSRVENRFRMCAYMLLSCFKACIYK